MKKYFFIFLILLQHLVVFAQFTDDFSDEGFVNNPSWFGNTSKFEINSAELLHHLYVIWMKVFSENAATQRFKKVAVLSR